jgi:hypothetical protein
MQLSKYFLPLGLLACVPVAGDDTGALKVGDSEPSEEQPSSEPTSEPPATEFSPTFLGFFAVSGVSGVSLTGYSVDGQPTNGYFAAILANDDWSGMDDALNACYVYFDVIPESSTFTDSFVESGAFAGWTLDPAATFNTTGGACADLNAENADLVDFISQANVGFGFGPLSANSDFEESIQTTVIDQLGQEEWDASWAPNVFAMWVHVDGLTEEPQAINYSFAYDVNDLETFVPFDGASPLEEGVYIGNPWFIFPL